MKAASCALAVPNDALTKSATSAMLAILFTSSCFRHQFASAHYIAFYTQHLSRDDFLAEE
jgi:hypothetical protein